MNAINYKYSIIIPHRNLPDLLQRCLDSIPDRDDVQVIIVDDKSDPEKVVLGQFPGLGRKNTEVYFDKTGRGAGRARNVGLEHACGEWLLFADCDDYYNTQNLNRLMDMKIPEQYQVVAWGTETKSFDGSTEFFFADNRCSIEPFSFESAIKQFAPWRTMVRASVVRNNNIRFEEILASNDLMFHLMVMGSISHEQVGWFPQVIYTWEKRQGSLMHRFTKAPMLARFEASLRANRYALDHGWGMVDDTRNFLYQLGKLSTVLYIRKYVKLGRVLGWTIANDIFEQSCSSRLLRVVHPYTLWNTIQRKFTNK